MSDDYSDEIPFPSTQGNIRQPGLVEHNARVKAQREADCANPKRNITTEEAELQRHQIEEVRSLSLASERDALQAENARLREALDELLRCTEKHVFGDECKAQRNKARAALGKTQ
jgi:hypothetical protein